MALYVYSHKVVYLGSILRGGTIAPKVSYTFWLGFDSQLRNQTWYLTKYSRHLIVS